MSTSAIDDDEARLRTGGSATAHLVSDLRSLISDDELTDVTLRGTDGVTVPAVKVLLAARSPVFRRMFFGPFLESSSEVVPVGYPSAVVRYVVEFCYTADVSLPPSRRSLSRSLSRSVSATAAAVLRSSSSSSSPALCLPPSSGVEDDTETVLRNLVRLVAAGSFYEIHGLETRVLRLIFDVVRRWKPLACVVFDEALAGGAATAEVARLALAVIRRMPEFILLTTRDGEDSDGGGGDGGGGGGGCGGGLSALSEAAMREVIADEGMQCDEATIFQFLQRWVDAGERKNIAWKGSSGNGNGIGKGGRSGRKRKRGQHQQLPPTEIREVPCSASDGDDSCSSPYESDLRSRAKELMNDLDLSKVAPRFLSDTVAPSGLVTTQRLLEAYKSQAMRAAEGVDISCCFAQFRSKRTKMVIVLGAGVARVNGVYTQDSPHRYSKPGEWRGNNVVYLLSKIGSRWYIWIQSRSVCFYCCVRSDGRLSPMWKTTTESEDFDDDNDDSVGDCQHMGAEPAPAFVWSI